jgi:hypothetical protein
VARKPWDQLDNESNAAYARFLAYRNLGPTRTLEKAYQSTQPETKRNKTKSFTQQWANDSTKFNWRDRATAWDVDNLLGQGERAATLYMGVVEKYIERLYSFLDQTGVEPDDFDSVTKSIELLHKLLPGETIGAIIAANEQRRTTGDG